MFKFGRHNVPDASTAGGRGSRAGDRRSDSSDDLKRRARQRLIGAVILVLTAVIVIPMLLDSEPRPLGQDISITIPPKDTPFNGQPAAAAPANSVAAAPIAAGAAAVAPVIESSSAATAAASTPTASAPATAAIQPAPSPAQVPAAQAPAQPSAAAVAAAVPASKPSSDKPAETTKPVAAAKVPDGNRALALLEDKPVNGQPVASDKFSVQVGAFASEEKVQELQARLKTAGVATYTEHVKTEAGERIRLRVGPFGTRGEAESALGKVKAAGISGAAVVQ